MKFLIVALALMAMFSTASGQAEPDTSDQVWLVHQNSQCHVASTQYNGDRTDNPIFNAGGFVGRYTLQQCRNICAEPATTDPHGRRCVAIEWSAHEDAGQTANCALAWGCETIAHWSGGQVQMLVQDPGLVDTGCHDMPSGDNPRDSCETLSGLFGCDYAISTDHTVADMCCASCQTGGKVCKDWDDLLAIDDEMPENCVAFKMMGFCDFPSADGFSMSDFCCETCGDDEMVMDCPEGTDVCVTIDAFPPGAEGCNGDPELSMKHPIMLGECTTDDDDEFKMFHCARPGLIAQLKFADENCTDLDDLELYVSGTCDSDDGSSSEEEEAQRRLFEREVGQILELSYTKYTFNEGACAPTDPNDPLHCEVAYCLDQCYKYMHCMTEETMDDSCANAPDDCMERCDGCIDQEVCDIGYCGPTCGEYAICAVEGLNEDPRCNDDMELDCDQCNFCIANMGSMMITIPDVHFEEGCLQSCWYMQDHQDIHLFLMDANQEADFDTFDCDLACAQQGAGEGDMDTCLNGCHHMQDNNDDAVFMLDMSQAGPMDQFDCDVACTKLMLQDGSDTENTVCDHASCPHCGPSEQWVNDGTCCGICLSECANGDTIESADECTNITCVEGTFIEKHVDCPVCPPTMVHSDDGSCCGLCEELCIDGTFEADDPFRTCDDLVGFFGCDYQLDNLYYVGNVCCETCAIASANGDNGKRCEDWDAALPRSGARVANCVEFALRGYCTEIELDGFDPTDLCCATCEKFEGSEGCTDPDADLCSETSIYIDSPNGCEGEPTAVEYTSVHFNECTLYTDPDQMEMYEKVVCMNNGLLATEMYADSGCTQPLLHETKFYQNGACVQYEGLHVSPNWTGGCLNTEDTVCDLDFCMETCMPLAKCLLEENENLPECEESLVECDARCRGCIDESACEMEYCAPNCLPHTHCYLGHSDLAGCDFPIPNDCRARCDACLYLPEGFVVPHPHVPADAGHVEIEDALFICGCELEGSRYCNVANEGISWMPCESCELIETRDDCLARDLTEMGVRSCAANCVDTDVPFEGWMNEIPNLHDCECEVEGEMFCDHFLQPSRGECHFCPGEIPGDSCAARALNLHGEQSCKNYCPEPEEIPCTGHDQCPSDQPFCYDGLCDTCDQCQNCRDGVDHTCGPCDPLTHPTNNPGEVCEPLRAEGGYIHNDMPWLNIDHKKVGEEASVALEDFTKETTFMERNSMMIFGGLVLCTGLLVAGLYKKTKQSDNNAYDPLMDDEI